MCSARLLRTDARLLHRGHPHGVPTGRRRVKPVLAAERNGRQRRGAVRYGSSTALITWTIPFDAEMSVAAMPAAESASRVSLAPFSMW